MEKYRLVKKIGQGSFGEVWLVKGSKTQKQYVLKQINLQHASKREQRAAHLQVKLLSTLKHPNIVSYLDSFYNSKGSLFIVMGYCENGDLYTCITNQNGIPFPEKQIVEWLIQICLALKYLHDKKILHRDLKTQNIFLTKSNLIKVGDLGVAHVLDRTTDLAATMIGTPYYMSPEIFCNKPYSFQSDVWALGCCMCEIATLKHAFHAGSFTSLVQRVLNRKVPGICEKYSQEFHDIVFSMLNIDPNKRPSITDILLNSYVKSHIVTFLEETRTSSRGLSVRSPKSADCQKENYISHIGVPGPKPCDASFSYRSQGLEENVDVPDLFFSKEHVFQTPDINGNGDGNDNSQQRYMAKNKSLLKNETENIKMVSCKNPGSNEIVHDLLLLRKHPVQAHGLKSDSQSLSELKASNFGSADKASRSNYSVRRALKSARRHGQMSLNFLRNLTYTISSAPDYPFLSSCKKTGDYQNTFWDSSNLPAISSGSPGLPSLVQSTAQFGFDHLKSKRFKSNEQSPSGGELDAHFIGCELNEKQLPEVAEQKENYACPVISSASENKYQLAVYKGSKIPIFNVHSQKENDHPISNKSRQFDSLFPEMSQHRLPLLKSNSEDCSTDSNHIDGSLLQKIINCNIKAKTMPGHLNSAARQRRREKEGEKMKAYSAEALSSDIKSTQENVDTEVQMCYKEDGAKRFIS